MSRRGSRFAVIAFVATLPLACKKKAPPVDAPPADAAVEPTPVVVASAEPPDAGPRIVSFAETMPNANAPPAQVSWGGFYKCGTGKGRLKLTHFESTVTGHLSTGAEEKTYTCTITRDTCVGTEVDVPQHTKKATPKTRKLTLRRDAHGTVHANAEGSAGQTCTKL